MMNEILLQTVASPWLYLLLFAVTLIDGFFPPIPSETMLVAAAAVTASSGDLWPLIPLGLVAALGAALGDNIAFEIGRRLGTTRWAWMRRPRVASSFAHAQRALDTRSAALILAARYVPIGRVAVNMSAGALTFPRHRFVMLSLAAGVSWSALSITIGLIAGAWIKSQPLVSGAIGVAVALALGLVIDRLVALRRRRTVEPHLAV